MRAIGIHGCFQAGCVFLIYGFCLLVESLNVHNASRNSFEQTVALTPSSINSTLAYYYDTLAPSANWQRIATGGDGKYIYGIVQDDTYVPVSATVGLPSASYSVLMSSDYGATWRSTPISNVLGAYFVSMGINSAENTRYYLFVDADTGCNVVGGAFAFTIFFSTDCGVTWITNGAIFTAIGGSSSGKDLIAVGSFGDDAYTPEHIFVSSTYGFTWDNITVPLSDYEFAAVASDADFVNVMVATCCSDNYCLEPMVNMYYNSNASHYSRNVGAWKILNASSMSCTNLDLVTDSSGSYWIANLGWGLIASIDYGHSWTKLHTPTEVHLWNSIACDSTCQFIVAGGVTTENAVSFISSDFGGSWKMVESASGTPLLFNSTVVAMTPSGDYFVVASSQSWLGTPGYVYVSSNPFLQITGKASSNSNEYSVNFTVSDLGTVVRSPLYLSLALVVSAYKKSNLSISLLTNKSALVSLGADVCVPVFPCNSTDDATVNETEYCLFNIPVNSSFVEDANGGSLSFVATISSVSRAGLMCLSNTTYFQLQYTISTSYYVAPVASTPENSPLLLFGPRFLMVLVFSVLSFSLFGGFLAYVYSTSSTTRNLSRAFTVVQFALLSGLVSAEIMFFYIFYNYNLKPYLWLSFMIVLTRIVFVIPGVLIWVESYNLKLEYFRTIPEVSELMDHDFVKGHRVVTTVVSFVVLLDPEVCISLPWKAASELTESTGSKKVEDVATQEMSEKSQQDKHNYFGYPTLHTLNLCLMFKLLTAIISVVFQLVCYGIEYTSTPAKDDHHSWKQKQLGVRIALWCYSIFYIISNLRSLVIFLNTRHYTEGTTIWQVAYKLGLYLGAFDARGRLERAFNAVNICRCGTNWWSVKSRLIMLKLFVAAYVFYITARRNDFKFKATSTDSTSSTSDEYYIASSWFYTVVVYSFAWLLDMSIAIEYENYNPQLDMAVISSSRKLDAVNITKLLSRSCVLFSACDIFAMYFLFRSTEWAEFINEFAHMAPYLLLFIEVISPLFLWTEHVWREEKDACKVLNGLIRIDIPLVCLFLKVMLLFVFPLSLLSNLSRINASLQLEALNAKSGNVISLEELSSKLLSFELRDNWETVDGESTEQSKAVSKRFKFLRRLFKRFSVAYSLSKLCGTIVLALYNNSELAACGSQGEYSSGGTCPVSYAWDEYIQDDGPMTISSGCVSFCFGKYPPQVTYPPQTYADCPPLPPTPWQCSIEISNACICNNWILFECTVLGLHVIHFLIQCYFYVRYSSFDPQQNQINCVETYTFVGNNLTLFLTRPLICSLSMIEAVCICIVWIKVILAPTVFCTRSNEFAFDAVRMEFALYITITEVYKANMSAFTRHWRQHHYWWAVFSLVRVDLSIFYGATLFFQAFFFPFSLVGACCGGTSSRPKTLNTEGDHQRTTSSAGISMIATTLQQEFVGEEMSSQDGMHDLEVAGTLNPVACPVAPVENDIQDGEVLNPISEAMESVEMEMVEKNVANDQ